MKHLLFLLNVTICFAGCCGKKGDNNNSFKGNNSGCCNGGACCGSKKPAGSSGSKSTSDGEKRKRADVPKISDGDLGRIAKGPNIPVKGNEIDGNAVKLLSNKNEPHAEHQSISPTKATDNIKQNNNNETNTSGYTNKNCISAYGNTPPLVGLENTGASCFMNSVLQCLSQTKGLTDYFLNQENEDKIINNNVANGNKNDPQLAPKYAKLIKQLWATNGPKSFSPNDFIDNICKMNPLWAHGVPGDAKDFIMDILERLHAELSNSIDRSTIIMNGSLDERDENEVYNNFLKNFYNTTSIIYDTFLGITQSTLECTNCHNNSNNQKTYGYGIINLLIFPLEEVKKMKIDNQTSVNNQACVNNQAWNNCQMYPMCNYQTYGYNQMFYYNQMAYTNQMGYNNQMGFNNQVWNNNQIGYNNPMGANNTIANNAQTDINTVTINDCLQYNERIELLNMHCNTCRTMREQNRIEKIHTAPKYLILIFNRGNGLEFNVKLEFAETIDISKFVLRNDIQSKYNLYGVVSHIGESSGKGHYIALCKSPVNKQWYKYNDNIVSPIANFQSEVINCATPYILFYERK